MSRAASKKKLKEIMGAQGTGRAISKAILEFLLEIPDEKDRLELFQYVIENTNDSAVVPPSGITISDHDAPSDRVVKRLETELGDLVNGYIKTLVLRRVSAQEFSTRMWNFILTFPEMEERYFALHCF